MMAISDVFYISHKKNICHVESLDAFLRYVNVIMPLINSLSNLTFFVKSTDARYLLVNDNLAKRCGMQCVKSIIGKKSEEVYHYDLGLGYSEQDEEVMCKNRAVVNRLELHSYSSGVLGWCLTTKMPVSLESGEMVGVVGISVDLQEERLIRQNINTKLKLVKNYIDENFCSDIKIKELSSVAEMSTSQLNRYFKDIFQITPQQFIQKKRLELAIDLLRNQLSITEIAAECGYSDHSAFSRKFKELTTMSPTDFKNMMYK